MLSIDRKYPLFFVLLLFDDIFIYPKEKNIKTMISTTIQKHSKEKNVIYQNRQGSSFFSKYLLEYEERDTDEMIQCASFIIDFLGKRQDSNQLGIKSFFIYRKGYTRYKISDTDTYIDLINSGITRANLYSIFQKTNHLLYGDERKGNSHISNKQLKNEYSIEFLCIFAYYLAELLSESYRVYERKKYYKEIASITKPKHYEMTVKLRIKYLLNDLHIYIAPQTLFPQENILNKSFNIGFQFLKLKYLEYIDIEYRRSKNPSHYIFTTSQPIFLKSNCFDDFLTSIFKFLKSNSISSVFIEHPKENKKLIQKNIDIYYDFLKIIRFYTLLIVETYIDSNDTEYSTILRKEFGEKEKKYQYENRKKLIIRFFTDISESLPHNLSSSLSEKIGSRKTVRSLVKLYPEFMCGYLELLNYMPIHEKLKIMVSLTKRFEKSNIIKNNSKKYLKIIQSGVYSKIDFYKISETIKKENDFLTPDVLDLFVLEDVYDSIII